MKAALILLVFGVCVALAVGLDNCWTKPETCQEDECCVKFTNFIGRCKKRKAEGENCGAKDLKQPFKDHVYLFQCPCEEGLTCVKKEGLVGHVVGTCQAGSGETTGDNGEE